MTTHTAHGITTYARSFSPHPFGDEQEAEGPYEIHRYGTYVRVIRSDIRTEQEYTEFLLALRAATTECGLV